MRIQELRELSFKLSYLPLVYPTFFLCVFLSHRSFSFRVLEKVGIRGCKVFREKYYPQGWRFFPKTGGLTLLFRTIPELPLHPEREWPSDASQLKGAKMEVNGSRGILKKKFQKEIRVRRKHTPKELPQTRKKNRNEEKYSRKRETGQTIPREVWASVCWNLFRRTDAYSSRFVCRGWWLVPFMGQAVTYGFPLPAQKKQQKRKPSEKP